MGKKQIILEKGTIEEIDNITSSVESSQELRDYYFEEIEKFNTKYSAYMDNLSKKNNRKENGDIALFTTINKERNRIKVLYKKHIETFKVIINIKDFEQYLKTNYYDLYCKAQAQKQLLNKNYFSEETSFLIRKIYSIYKKYSQENKTPSPDKIYNELKKQQSIENDNYSPMYDESNNDPTYPDKDDLYEKDFIEETNSRNKYYFEKQEKKGKTKILKNQWGK